MADRIVSFCQIILLDFLSRWRCVRRIFQNKIQYIQQVASHRIWYDCFFMRYTNSHFFVSFFDIMINLAQNNPRSFDFVFFFLTIDTDRCWRSCSRSRSRRRRCCCVYYWTGRHQQQHTQSTINNIVHTSSISSPSSSSRLYIYIYMSCLIFC